MLDYTKIAKEYQQLTADAANPSKVRDLAEIGEQISAIQDKAKIAESLVQLDAQAEETEALLADPEMAQIAKSELAIIQAKRKQLLTELAKLEEQELSTEDLRPAIMEFRPGAGGEEAKIWMEDLQRMYLRFAETSGLKYAYLDDNTLIFSGKPSDPTLPQGAYGLFKWESGVHRVQRVPTTESQGRIHTSTASIAVLPKVDKSKVEVKDEDLEWQFFRAGGKGGQNVNKVSTAVRLIHTPTGLTVVSSQERYQQRNREIALDLLLAKLWEIQEEERLAKLDATRRSAVGRGSRSEKIRTFNFPQNRVTDHRIGESWHNLESILEGNLTDLFTTLHQQITNTVKKVKK